MMDIFRGQRPDVTPAQVAAVLVAGIPAIATLLSAFGVADVSQAQQDALSGALTWCAVLAGLLIGGDATLRTARNVADSRRHAAVVAASAGVPATTGVISEDPDVDGVEAAMSVTDEEEFASAHHAAAGNGHGEFDDPDAGAVEQ
jgi:hypothetical protein